MFLRFSYCGKETNISAMIIEILTFYNHEAVFSFDLLIILTQDYPKIKAKELDKYHCEVYFKNILRFFRCQRHSLL